MSKLKSGGTSNSLALIVLLIAALTPGRCQREPSFPINAKSFSQFLRSVQPAPDGRAPNSNDVFIRFYSTNLTAPSTFRFRELSRLLSQPGFDAKRPTVLYAHGYLELVSDRSVRGVVGAYLRRGGYNTLALDWSNLAYGNYLSVSLNVATVGKETARAMSRLLKQGLSVSGLHFVGHSLGAHVLAYAARGLAARGFRLPRLTGLDPAYPGFYPPIFGQPMTKTDATFVDVIHTDGGGYGAPGKTGHADFWPNGGQAKQPGCLSATVPLSVEDFCSHWRSWRFWAESVESGEFLARRCDSYDAFLRGRCGAAQLVRMGLQADPRLRGNFYLRTAVTEPYTLREVGAS